MATIQLIPITRTNWRECARLKVADDQQHFVAPNMGSLAQAAYEANWMPFAIYDGQSMVGFTMFGLDEWTGPRVWGILRLMVAEAHQGKGYGTEAMRLVLEFIRRHPSRIEDVYISYVPENTAAPHIYSKLGFKKIGKTPDGEEDLMHLAIALPPEEDLPSVQLVPITRHNWQACVSLQVGQDQRNRVAPNMYSLAQAAYLGDQIPMAIYAGTLMVGFVMFGQEEHEGQQVWSIGRLMIAAPQQGKGYGEAALHEVLARLSRHPSRSEDVYIGHTPENAPAAALYRKLGFKNVWVDPDDDEQVMHLKLGLVEID
ncbi:MAG: GNAT family N-acetyltransferase [Chloroflexi bacterium]|nr:GNAT family N-acetyltransferase [Chloroflexota bacterium]